MDKETAMRELMIDVARAAQEDAFDVASRHYGYGSRYRLTVDLDRLERIVDSVEVPALYAISMTHAAEVAVALREWEKNQCHGDTGNGCGNRDSGNDLATLLRSAPESFDVMRAWCRMYENHSEADKAMRRDSSFTAQDHALRVFLRERFGL